MWSSLNVGTQTWLQAVDVDGDHFLISQDSIYLKETSDIKEEHPEGKITKKWWVRCLYNDDCWEVTEKIYLKFKEFILGEEQTSF